MQDVLMLTIYPDSYADCRATGVTKDGARKYRASTARRWRNQMALYTSYFLDTALAMIISAEPGVSWRPMFALS